MTFIRPCTALCASGGWRGAHPPGGSDHVDQRRPDLFPAAGLEPAIRVDPDLLRRQAGPRLVEERRHLLDIGQARRMDVIDAWPDLVGIAVADESVEQLHPRTRGLD